jgi:hypothetical protein
VNVNAESSGGDGSFINIKVHNQTVTDMFFHVKRDMKLWCLIDMYSRKHLLDSKVIKFLGPKGGYIQADQMSEEAKLEDHDAIDVFLTQTGGVRAPLHASQFSA